MLTLTVDAARPRSEVGYGAGVIVETWKSVGQADVRVDQDILDAILFRDGIDLSTVSVVLPDGRVIGGELAKRLREGNMPLNMYQEDRK